ncbi:MAG: conjugal transfer protein TraR [Alkalimonas sp.]|nr:conjugal transfer protein TraR [Alkalimonas sp.]
MSIQLNQLRTRLLDEQQQLQQQIQDFLNQQDRAEFQQLRLQLMQLSLARWPEVLLHWHTPELSVSGKRLEAVQAALSQMEMGLYGICCDCELIIENQRLEQDPAEQRCGQCAD